MNFAKLACLCLLLALLPNCATLPWAKAVAERSSELVPVATLSPDHQPGALVSGSLSEWTVLRQPAPSASLCMTDRRVENTKFDVKSSFTGSFFAEAKKFGLAVDAGASDSSDLSITIDDANLTAIKEYTPFLMNEVAVEIVQNKDFYARLAAKDELFIVTKALCAKKIVITRSDTIAASGSGEFELQQSPVKAGAGASWKKTANGSLEYIDAATPICFGAKLQPISKVDFDTIVKQATTLECPGPEALFDPVKMKFVRAECFERWVTTRMQAAASLAILPSATPTCRQAALIRLQTAVSMKLASEQLRAAESKATCGAGAVKDEADPKVALEEARERFRAAYENAKVGLISGGVLTEGDKVLSNPVVECPELVIPSPQKRTGPLPCAEQ